MQQVAALERMPVSRHGAVVALAEFSLACDSLTYHFLRTCMCGSEVDWPAAAAGPSGRRQQRGN
jgi:hypothetical protein